MVVTRKTLFIETTSLSCTIYFMLLIIARDEMMKNKNGKGLRRLKGIFNVKQPGETVSVDDGKPRVGEKLKVT